jgi:hypothetical protein
VRARVPPGALMPGPEALKEKSDGLGLDVCACDCTLPCPWIRTLCKPLQSPNRCNRD